VPRLAKVHAKEVVSDLKKQQIEILTEERLVKIIDTNPKPVTYIGFEPSNSFSIGNWSASLPVLKLTKFGFKGIILLADLHALANDKGDMNTIQEFAGFDKKMYERIAAKMGLGGKLEYKFGTDFENQEYFIQLLKLARIVNFTEAEKSMDEISKSSVKRMTSSVIYPLMQALDIGVLGVNVAVGGIDQRKVHTLAIENLKKLGYPTPVAIHTPILLGTDGKNKMHKSARNTIDLDETQESLEAKIRKTYCAPGDVETNPILDWYKALIFSLNEGVLEFGNKSASNFSELETLWAKREISPQELKAAAVRDLGKILF
jgi:tyrosyl-tRNA synthetase